MLTSEILGSALGRCDHARDGVSAEGFHRTLIDRDDTEIFSGQATFAARAIRNICRNAAGTASDGEVDNAWGIHTRATTLTPDV
jgi:hypothetical protein